MKTLMNFTKIAFLALTLFGVVSCADDDDNGNMIDNGDSNTIADFVANNDDYSSLLAALEQTGLTATLAGSGNFTVFAPNNAAFDAFLDGAALADIDNDVLTQVLLNHVLNIAVTADQLTTGYQKNLATEASTGANLDMFIDTAAGVMINGQSTVTAADISTDNGVIHAVDSVIALPTIVTFATADPNFATLVAALTADSSFGYVGALQTPNGTSPAPFTVFAPINSAFDALLGDLGLTELSEIAVPTLAATLELHVITGLNVRAEDLPGLDGAAVSTLGGANITVQADPAAIIDPDGGENPIIVTNVQASNGVIHAVSRVLRDL